MNIFSPQIYTYIFNASLKNCHSKKSVKGNVVEVLGNTFGLEQFWKSLAFTLVLNKKFLALSILDLITTLVLAQLISFSIIYICPLFVFHQTFNSLLFYTDYAFWIKDSLKRIELSNNLSVYRERFFPIDTATRPIAMRYTFMAQYAFHRARTVIWTDDLWPASDVWAVVWSNYIYYHHVGNRQIHLFGRRQSTSAEGKP